MFLYPWGDMHSLNLGWFLLQFKDWVEKIQEYLDNGGGTSENLANVIAPVFNAANSYLTGDYVLYNNELYKANQAVNPGTWDPDAWTRCLVTEEMGSGSSGVDNVARLMIAGQYSATYNYQKYAICRYNDKLWMCNTNLPAGGEEWTPSHWDEITVGAGLTGLRRSVETLAQTAALLNGAIAHIKNLTSASKALLIGDSYNYGSGGIQPYGWGYYLQQISGATCDIVHQNGGGFTTPGASVATYPNKTYVQLVSDLDASKNYDFVIVQNGQNDGNHGSVSGINTAVPAFMTAIKEKYPNALVWIIPVWNDSGIAEAKNDILKATAEQAVRNGARTCFNSWQWMVGTGLNSDYENHLTDVGYQVLAKYIFELVNGWSGEKNNLLKNYVGVYPINPSNASIAARGQAYQFIYGNLSIFHGFFRCTSAVARTEVIYELMSGYTYDTLTNVYISTATSDPTATVNLTAGGNVVVSNADGLDITPTAYPWNPYEIWLISNCRKNG